jgi:hypothetical protein
MSMPAHPQPSVVPRAHGIEDHDMEIVFAILLIIVIGLLAQAVGADSRADGSIRY